MNELIQKIPKPVLVIGCMLIAVIYFIYTDPIKDECDVQAKNFEKNMKGVLVTTKKNKKIQYAMISSQIDRCKEGNSIGACREYFDSLYKLTQSLKSFSLKCQAKFLESEENQYFLEQIKIGIKLLALIAWGDKPPESASERVGWLSEAQLKSFCSLKSHLIQLLGEEYFFAYRERIYQEYPDVWTNLVSPKGDSDLDNRKPDERPKAYNYSGNPKGKYNKSQIFEKSLFSLKCDFYL